MQSSEELRNKIGEDSIMNITKGNKGFSLVELMVVVAIIGVLAALAVPRFRVFQAKARQAEAKTNLTYIYALEESHFSEYDKYATMAPHGKEVGCQPNDLGFLLNPCEKSRYKYKVDAADTTFTATADTGSTNGVMAGCEIPDKWMINEQKELKATSDSVKKCD